MTNNKNSVILTMSIVYVRTSQIQMCKSEIQTPYYTFISEYYSSKATVAKIKDVHLWLLVVVNEVLEYDYYFYFFFFHWLWDEGVSWDCIEAPLYALPLFSREYLGKERERDKEKEKSFLSSWLLSLPAWKSPLSITFLPPFSHVSL